MTRKEINMKRLTKRDFIFDLNYVASNLQSWSIAECLKKLQEYENAEEDGKLLFLPCKVGEKAWFVRKTPGGVKSITETAVEKIVLKSGGLYIKLACNAMLVELSIKHYGSFTGDAFIKAVEVLNTAPTVDAVEVVHGYWKTNPLVVGGECSVCGWDFEWFENDEAHYCPHCGAKMDLKGGDEK